MAQKSITVHCGKCNHEWRMPIALPMPIDKFVRLTKRHADAGCPSCGANGRSDVLCGPAPRKR